MQPFFLIEWDSSSLEWIQEENPLSVTNQDMEPKEVKIIPSNYDIADFVGLSLSDKANTLMDGSSSTTYRWYTIGYKRGYLYDEDKSPATPNQRSRSTSLFIFIPGRLRW